MVTIVSLVAVSGVGLVQQTVRGDAICVYSNRGSTGNSVVVMKNCIVAIVI